MSPLIIAREGVISLGKDVFEPYPFGRASSWCGVLMPFSLVVHFLEGDEDESWSFGLCFL